MYMRVSKNKFVTVTYDLHVGEGQDRELKERATPDQPMKFIYGNGDMLEAFEKNLSGLEVGDRFEFTLTPEQAFGPHDEESVQDIPKDVFMFDGVFDSERVKEGAMLPMMTGDGQRIMGIVKEVKDDVVVMDFNHPLAGETLHFAGQVADVHEPTAEELAEMEQMMHGGCGGHDHDGCGGCDVCCH